MRKNKQPIQELISEGNRGPLGNFIRLTDKYCIVPQSLAPKILISLQRIFAHQAGFKIVPCCMNDIPCVGVMCVGNNKGLVLPYSTTDSELQHITNCMPDGIVVHRLEDSLTGLTALGNLVAANDSVGFASPELSVEARERIKEVLGLSDLFLCDIERYSLTGTYFCINNFGLLVPKDLCLDEINKLVTLSKLPVSQGSCADGKSELGKEFVVNNTHLMCDGQSFQLEIAAAQKIFHVQQAFISQNTLRMRSANAKDDSTGDVSVEGGEFEVIDEALLEAIL